MLRRLHLHLLLAFALLVAQQIAFAHAQTHALKGSTPDSQVCEVCVVAAQLGNAPVATTASFDIDLRFAVAAHADHAVFLPRPTRSFCSRAPPSWF